MSSENVTLAFATVREMRAALSGFGPRLEIGPGESARTTLFGREVRVLVTGISPVNAALSLGGLLGGREHVAGVVGLGVAGSF
ncbi:MAG: futalosine hydrolase, partial [Thermodesulfobacteriota bacterium]|nr:futalosine hydrolase [Thermodesulfobacteriota bacterium]